jgi:hypothetical protein
MHFRPLSWGRFACWISEEMAVEVAERREINHAQSERKLTGVVPPRYSLCTFVVETFLQELRKCRLSWHVGAGGSFCVIE